MYFSAKQMFKMSRSGNFPSTSGPFSLLAAIKRYLTFNYPNYFQIHPKAQKSRKARSTHAKRAKTMPHNYYKYYSKAQMNTMHRECCTSARPLFNAHNKQ